MTVTLNNDYVQKVIIINEIFKSLNISKQQIFFLNLVNYAVYIVIDTFLGENYI